MHVDVYVQVLHPVSSASALPLLARGRVIVYVSALCQLSAVVDDGMYWAVCWCTLVSSFALCFRLDRCRLRALTAGRWCRWHLCHAGTMIGSAV